MPMTDRPPLTDEARAAVAVAMRSLVADISEYNYAASWQDGIERFVWRAVQSGTREYHGYGYEGDLIPTLRELSALIDGWVDYDGYVPMTEWLARQGRD